MKVSENLLQSIITRLETCGLLKTLNRVDLFYDEPKFFKYAASLNYQKKYSDGFSPHEAIVAGGFSFTSKYESLIKCLGESIERLSLYCYKKKSITFSSFKDFKTEVLDPSIYKNIDSIRGKKFGWVRGYNLTKNTNCFLPVQLIYLNYRERRQEIPLSTVISTGAAGGFDHQETLLRGIYEVVERDAFMTAYLTKAKVPRINLERIKSKVLQFILAVCKRYNLELLVFNLANDLSIPVFMTILIDTTGLGPPLSVGIKSSLMVKEAILGSIAESLMGRLSQRNQLYRKKSLWFNIKPSSIDTLDKRGLFWLAPEKLEKLNFWLQQTPEFFSITQRNINSTDQLLKVVKLLKHKGIEIFYVDITPAMFRKSGYLVYKIIIPKLQPLYLIEKSKVFRMERIQSVSKYFGQKKLFLNTYPHPFL